MPLFSIILPVHDSSMTIERCVDSVLAQTCGDFELLIVDDGSRDDSAEICRRYTSDTRVSLFCKENGGVSSARNYALDRATGEYVVFVDSDDFVYPDYLDIFLREPHSDMLVQNIRISDGGDSSRCLYPTDESGTWMTAVEFCRLGPWGHPVNKRFRRSIIEEHSLRFDERLSMFEDEVFFAGYSRFVDTLYLTGDAGYHYFEPASFGKKYGDSFALGKLVRQYRLVSSANPALSETVIDRLVISSLDHFAAQGPSCIGHLMEEMSPLKADFSLLKRKKLFLFRLLRHTRSAAVWQCVYGFYSKHPELYS